MKHVHEYLDEVKDEKSFLAFAKALIEDRLPCEGQKSDEVGFVGDWANNSIADFLESAVAWAEDSDFGVSLEKDLQQNKWKQFAIFLYCGKIYE